MVRMCSANLDVGSCLVINTVRNVLNNSHKLYWLVSIRLARALITGPDRKSRFLFRSRRFPQLDFGKAVKAKRTVVPGMSAKRVYLDHNATTPMLPAAIEAMQAAMLLTGNPSSLHAEGRAARSVLEEARRALASAIGGKAENIVFTSGGTESAASLLAPEWVVEGNRRGFTRLVVSAAEHACLMSGGRFDPDQVAIAPVDGDGVIDLAALDQILARIEKPLLAIQHANNETGVIQPIDEIAAIARAHLALIVCDSVQSFGKMPVSFDALDVDALFVSAHKIGGPEGVGAIIYKDSRITPASALIGGGGQQKGFRAGTENVAGIAGFGAAARAVPEAIGKSAAIAALRDRFETELLAAHPEAVIFGHKAERLPNTSLFGLPDVPAETSLIAYDLAGFAVSSGSACSSGKVKASHVLLAMGVSRDLAACAIRLSIGNDTQWRDLERFLDAVGDRKNVAARKHRNIAAVAA
jgi:cysteine desulfurase